jgi:hypothetical protein
MNIGGELIYIIIETIESMPADHKIHQLSPIFFRKWLKAIFGVKEKLVYRVTSLLRYTRFYNKLKFFIGIRYG